MNGIRISEPSENYFLCHMIKEIMANQFYGTTTLCVIDNEMKKKVKETKGQLNKLI